MGTKYKYAYLCSFSINIFIATGSSSSDVSVHSLQPRSRTNRLSQQGKRKNLDCLHDRRQTQPNRSRNQTFLAADLKYSPQ